MKPVPNKQHGAAGPQEENKQAATVQAKAGRHAEPMRQAGKAVHAGVYSSINDVLRIEADLVQLVRATVRDSLMVSGQSGVALTEVVGSVVQGAISAVEHAGAGLTLSAKTLAKGIVLGVHEVNGDVIAAAFETARALVRQSATTGTDLGRVARQAISGVIEAGSEIGAEIGVIAGQAARGAIIGAGDISKLAMSTVSEMVRMLAGRDGTMPAPLPEQAGEHSKPLAH